MSQIFENVSNRFIKSSTNGNISLTDELNILEYLVEKFKLLSISDYADMEKLSYPGALYRIKSGKVMSIKLAGQVFIIN